MSEMLFLAAPYTGSPAEIVERMASFVKIDAQLMRDGYFTVSPLLKHFLSDVPKDWEYWSEYSKTLLKLCKAVIVIMFDGWEESVGLQSEIAIANECNIPVIYYDPITKLFK